MQCNHIHLAATLQAGPLAATQAVQAALAAAGASIVSAEQLGNHGLVFGFELRAGQLPALRDALQRCARLLDLSEQSVKRLVRELQPDIEVHGTLHVILSHAAG